MHNEHFLNTGLRILILLNCNSQGIQQEALPKYAFQGYTAINRIL